MKIFENFLILLGTALLQNDKGPTYTVVLKDQNFQVRDYDSWVVAETIVEQSHQDAGSQAFHILAGYIFGKNDKGVKIEMTAPVTEYEVSPGKYAVQFYMPAEWTIETLPKPLDNRVVIKQIPRRRLAVIRYHGGWSEGLYTKELKELQTEAADHQVSIKSGSKPIWARYNSPMAPSPVRTNQVMFQVSE